MSPVALLSAYHKTPQLQAFARFLREQEWRMLGSRGTALYLREAAIHCESIDQMVGEPILGHRVVTLSRQIHAALLAEDTPEDNAELERIGMPRIDLLYVDLYPLETEAVQLGRTLNSMLEMTDIGGPAMLMAGVKGKRLVLTTTGDLRDITFDIKNGSWKSEPLRCVYARRAVQLVTNYYRHLIPVLEEAALRPT